MQDLMNTSVLTMSSQEIADLVGARHDKVRQSIERLAARTVIRLPPMGEAETINNLGFRQAVKLYHLGKRDSIVVVAQMSPEFTGQLVDRWQELEVGLLRTPVLLEYQAKLESLEAEMAVVRPKALAFDRLDGVPGSEPISNVAKALGVPVKQMFEKMKALRWIFYRGGRWLGYANKLKQGLLCHHVDTLYTEEAEEKSFVQLRVTAKGVGKLASLVA
jgi:phage regulator Rha-like protein